MKTAFNHALYHGRQEPYENELAQYYYQHIKAYQNQPICLVGFGCDQGVNRNQGRIGAKHAPDVIKSAFGKLPIHLSLQKKYRNLSHLIGDMGNIICADDDKVTNELLENTQDIYAKTISQIIHHGSLPIGLGGGHEIAYGSFMGLYHAINNNTTNTADKKRIGIINLDAHFDLRSDKYATSGTPFLQIADFLQKNNEPFFYLAIGISEFANTGSLFAKADSLGVNIISEEHCYRLAFDDIKKQIDDFIAHVDVIYLTLDLDVLQANFMPAVSAVNAKGLSLDFIENCLAYLIQSGKIKMMDVAEFNPNYDIDGRGAKVVARILAGVVQRLLT